MITEYHKGGSKTCVVLKHKKASRAINSSLRILKILATCSPSLREMEKNTVNDFFLKIL